MRERQGHCCRYSSLIRITPACTGKTQQLRQILGRSQDHPRMCGKDLPPGKSLLRIVGSPPHVRERPFGQFPAADAVGITPACAGKTYRSNRHRYRLWDHPRMCGKDRLTQQSESLTTGSPPHVRERLRDAHRPRLVPGITPACAGKTSFCYLFVRLHEDHPRMCGKDLIQYHSYNPPLGSPPHVRERPDYTQSELEKARITPACAGKTQ